MYTIRFHPPPSAMSRFGDAVRRAYFFLTFGRTTDPSDRKECPTGQCRQSSIRSFRKSLAASRRAFSKESSLSVQILP